MPRTSSDPPGEIARREQRRYLYDMLEQLAAMAVALGERQVADMLLALVAVYGDSTCAAADDGG